MTSRLFQEYPVHSIGGPAEKPAPRSADTVPPILQFGLNRRHRTIQPLDDRPLDTRNVVMQRCTRQRSYANDPRRPEAYDSDMPTTPTVGSSAFGTGSITLNAMSPSHKFWIGTRDTSPALFRRQVFDFQESAVFFASNNASTARHCFVWPMFLFDNRHSVALQRPPIPDSL